MNRWIRSMITLCALLFLFGGCGMSTYSAQKVSSLTYTVVKEEDIPKELQKQMEEQKQNGFNLTYLDGEYLYIARGFGEQKTGGYSVSVKELYLSENAIYFSAELFGPKKGEFTQEAKTYPYVVIKTERRTEPIVFL